MSSFPRWPDPCWHPGLISGFLGENAVRTWHSPDPGLAQSTGRTFKTIHTLESKPGATPVSASRGSVATCWPSPWPHTAFLPSALGNSFPVTVTVTATVTITT